MKTFKLHINAHIKQSLTLYFPKNAYVKNVTTLMECRHDPSQYIINLRLGWIKYHNSKKTMIRRTKSNQVTDTIFYYEYL